MTTAADPLELLLKEYSAARIANAGLMHELVCCLIAAEECEKNNADESVAALVEVITKKAQEGSSATDRMNALGDVFSAYYGVRLKALLDRNPNLRKTPTICAVENAASDAAKSD